MAAGDDGVGPLAGIKVLDLTLFANGPIATMQLADQGADVLKVTAATGEPLLFAAPPGYFTSGLEFINRGKRAMTLDLKHPGAKSVMERLCKWADVLCENFRPGVMEKLGYGYDVVKTWNPRLIYASNSGFGPKGEWAHRPSYDGMAQAFTGVLAFNGGGPSHQPREVPWTFSDVMGANNFYGAILAAIIARYRTGRGQRVETSQTGATLFFQGNVLAEILNGPAQGKQDDSGRSSWERAPWQQAHKCSDGKWVCVSMIQTPQFQRLCKEALERPELLTEKVVKAWPGGSLETQDWLRGEIAKTIATRTQEEWLHRLLAADVPCSPVAYAELADERNTVGAHLRENGYILAQEHREFGPVKMMGSPNAFSDTPNPTPPAHMAHIGEHTDEVLRKELGYSEEETSALVSSGAVPKPAGPYTEEASREKRAQFAKRLAEARSKL